MGLVLPIEDVKKIALELIKNGRVERGYIGLNALAPLSAQERKEMDLNMAVGLRVGGVVKGGPAERAFIREGDVILKFNGEWIGGLDQFKMLVATAPVNGNATLIIIRDGVRKTVTVRIGKQAAGSAR